MEHEGANAIPVVKFSGISALVQVEIISRFRKNISK
jgi:hypothetical protein